MPSSYFGPPYWAPPYFGPSYFGNPSTPPVPGSGVYCGSYWGTPYWGAGYFLTVIVAGPTLSIREAIVAAILADGPTIAVFGSKIFPIVIDEGTLPPALTYEIIDIEPVKNLGGESGLSLCKVRLVSRSKTLREVATGTKGLKNLFASFKGVFSGIKIKGVVKMSEEDSITMPDDASDRATFAIAVEYDIWFADPLPVNQVGD
jgi:hypothetical protein